VVEPVAPENGFHREKNIGIKR